MNELIISLRTAKSDLEDVDKHAVISDWMMASQLIRRAALLLKERSQVLFNSGWYAPDTGSVGNGTATDVLEAARHGEEKRYRQHRQPGGQAD